MPNGLSTGVALLVWLAVLAIWACFGLLGGHMARQYGYAYWIGFLIGFFGGIIGILVLWLIGRSRADDARRRAQYGQPPYPPWPGYGPPNAGPGANPHAVCPNCRNLVRRPLLPVLRRRDDDRWGVRRSDWEDHRVSKR